MKSNIYYFDETGRQKNNHERDSFSFETSPKESPKEKPKTTHKLQNKSYLNILFYAWFIICIVFIISYLLLYNYSKKRHNMNKKNIPKNETLIAKGHKEPILPKENKENKNRTIIHKNETLIIKENQKHILPKENRNKTIIQKKETKVVKEHKEPILIKENKNKIIIKKNETLNVKKPIDKKLPIQNKNIIISDKIRIAFVFRDKLLNDIEVMLLILANKLVEFDKYDIYLITQRDLHFDLEIDHKIKLIQNISNQASLENFDKKVNIKIYILNNELSYNTIKIYKSLNGGKKVIGIMQNAYFSFVYTNSSSVYSRISNINLYDAFLSIIPDEYFIFEKLGIKNTFYIPQLYNFLPQNIPNSRLINRNILIIGKERELLKGGIYGIKVMNIIVKSIPNAKLYIISSNHSIDFLKNLVRQLHLENNIEILYDDNVNKTQYYLNSSLLLYPSISESYSYIMNEAKSHAIPIIAFNLSYNPSYHKGVILVENLNYTQMAIEAIRILNNFEYRKIKGLEAKLSLYEYILKNEITGKFKKLLNLILNRTNTEEYRKFQNDTYRGYYFHNIAKERLELDYKYAQKFNNFFLCHSFNDMERMDFIKNIPGCKNLNFMK